MHLFEFCLSDENIYIVALDFLYSLSSHFFPSPQHGWARGFFIWRQDTTSISISEPSSIYFIPLNCSLPPFSMLLAIFHPTRGFSSTSTSNRIDEYVQKSMDAVLIHGTCFPIYGWGTSTSYVQHNGTPTVD